MMTNLKSTVLLLAVLLTKTFSGSAQQDFSRRNSAADILQELTQFNSLGSVLYIAAHPDDENTRLLGYLVGERKLRTAYMSLTRGDGGQNLIGKEQGAALGLIRTQELLAARGVDGAEQFFSRAFDFGYSKNPEETFRFWNKDEVLSDVVWVIRNYKPDIIICRFPTTGEGGHGHHTASAILAEEAYAAAADPKRYPEQLKHTQVWQAKGLFWNTFNFGGLNTTSEDQIKLDVGTYNFLTGKSYGEIAGESRSMHKSQGFGTASRRGEQFEYFKQLKGSPEAGTILKGQTPDWNTFPETKAISPLLEEIMQQFNPKNPALSIPALNNLYKKIAQLDFSKNPALKSWQAYKLEHLRNIIAHCAGIWLELSAQDYITCPGDHLDLSLQAIARNTSAKVQLQKISFNDKDSSLQLDMKPNELYNFHHQLSVGAQVPYSTPYWLVLPHTAGSFVVQDPLLIGKAENDPAMNAKLQLLIDGAAYVYTVPVVYKHTDPVKGELSRPLEILPLATVNPVAGIAISKNGKPQSIKFLVKANADNLKGKLLLKCTEGWKIVERQFEINLAKKGDELILQTAVVPDKKAGLGTLYASLQLNGNTMEKAIERIAYDHIPPQFSLEEASVRLVSLDLKKGGNQIAYIVGAGDDMPQSLEQIGYQLTLLQAADIPQTDLSRYDAVITGIRAYNTHPELNLYHDQLMDYVKQGGNLIVQYNTSNRISSVTEQIGPYPFKITRNRVTDELATMRILDPKQDLFNIPNKIDAQDFEGWIQERGIYFAVDSANHYQKVFAVKDPNEEEQDGSTLVAAYGKGNFIYTGLAFFRQLPAGVPGAYRLFVNMINMPKHEETK